MLLGEAIITYLKSCTNLITLVDNKIYPLIIPQQTVLPAITYQKVSSEYMNGISEGNYGLTSKIYQFSIFGTTYAKVNQVAKEIKICLNNYKGMMGGIGGIDILGCFLNGETDGFDNSTKEYFIYLEFRILHNE